MLKKLITIQYHIDFKNTKEMLVVIYKIVFSLRGPIAREIANSFSWRSLIGLKFIILA